MHRAQVLLYEHHYSFLKTESERQGKTISGLLREIIDNYLQNQAREDDPLWDLIGMAEGEGKAIGREHDKYLYGDKR
jgi:hypothetical protein